MRYNKSPMQTKIDDLFATYGCETINVAPAQTIVSDMRGGRPIPASTSIKVLVIALATAWQQARCDSRRSASPTTDPLVQILGHAVDAATGVVTAYS